MSKNMKMPKKYFWMWNSWKFSCQILHFFYATDYGWHLLHNQLQVPSVANQKLLSDICWQINYPLPFWSWRNKLRPKISNARFTSLIFQWEPKRTWSTLRKPPHRNKNVRICLHLLLLLRKIIVQTVLNQVQTSFSETIISSTFNMHLFI